MFAVCNIEATAGSSRQAADGSGSKCVFSGSKRVAKRVCKEVSKERATGRQLPDR